MDELTQLLKASDFAAKKHKGQKRKGANAEPYINHPLEVVKILADVGRVSDLDILIAALLHDTVEDTETTAEEITEYFGEIVCGYVLEVTDDKTLPKAERKQLQVDHAPHLSSGAKQIKLADKISNIEDMVDNPPVDWTLERKVQYVEWGISVVAGLRGANRPLEDLFDETVDRAQKKIAKS